MLVDLLAKSIIGHNPLCISNISLNLSKHKNFEPKILLCAELAVLSVRNANIVMLYRRKPFIINLKKLQI